MQLFCMCHQSGYNMFSHRAKQIFVHQWVVRNLPASGADSIGHGRGEGARAPHFYNWLGTGDAVSITKSTWAERSGKISRSLLSSIYGSPAHRSVPAPTTSRSRSTCCFEPRSPLRSAQVGFRPAPLLFRSAHAPLTCSGITANKKLTKLYCPSPKPLTVLVESNKWMGTTNVFFRDLAPNMCPPPPNFKFVPAPLPPAAGQLHDPDTTSPRISGD